jgi:predicted nucleotidyltransferase component of viral defense system
MMKKNNTHLDHFDHIVALALRSPGLATMRPVIEKEILHYDLLYALDQTGLLTNLVFQGGTCLRLCYAGSRFSEDLDFCGGADFTSRDMKSMKECLEDYLTTRYGLKVRVKEPGSLRNEPKYSEINIDKWQISVETAPNRPDIPRQKIKIEIANIPAYTCQARPLVRNYDFLPDGYSDIFLLAETMNEILADKVLALPATQRYIRYRDIWDLAWLQQRGATLDCDLLCRKLEDYKVADYDVKVEQLVGNLSNILNSIEFHAEMKRFLPSSVLERTLEKEHFTEYLNDTLNELFTNVLKELHPNAGRGKAAKFEM